MTEIAVFNQSQTWKNPGVDLVDLTIQEPKQTIWKFINVPTF